MIKQTVVMLTRFAQGIMVACIAGGALSLPARAEPVTVQYMDWKLNDAQAIADFYKAAAQKFMAANPDIRLELVPIQWEQHLTKLISQIQAGLPPDGVRLNVGDMAAIMPLVQPIDTPLQQVGAYDEIVAQIPRSFLDAYDMRDGRLIGLPQDITADGLTYNKEMFVAAGLDPSKPPATWAEFIAVAKKLTQPPKQYGYSLFGAKSASSARRWLRVFWDAGCEVITRDATHATMMAKPECIAAFKREIDFARVDHITPPGAANADFNFIMTGFAQGRIAMMLGGANNSDIAEGMTSGMKAKMAMAPMPEHGTSIAGGDNVVIPIGAKHPIEIARWIAFMSTKDMQVQSALVTRLAPSRHDALADPRIQADPFLAFHVADDALHPGYLTPKWPKVENAMMDMVQSALLGDETPEEALKTATRKIDAILAAP